MKNNKLRVLLIAHEFSPIKGSESAVGWNIATRLCKYHDITVLYASGSQFRHTSYVDTLNNYFRTSQAISGLTCINIDRPLISKLIAYINFPFRKLSNIGLPVIYYIGYKYWQKSVFKVGKQLHQENKFDVVHQLTQITFREPGYMWKLDIPFVWGPTGGMFTFPKKFRKELSIESKILINIRSFSNFFQSRFVHRIVMANKKAAIIYAFSHKDADYLRKKATGQVKLMNDVGTYYRPNINFDVQKDENFLNGIWCGRLSDFKAPAILLKALALSELTKKKIKFTIIGSGTLEDEMHGLSSRLNLQNIKWIRKVNHDKVFELMKGADFLVHTSIQEATSSVITEALTMGLPVICHDAFGMAIAINKTCGIKIPLISMEDSINGFHNAMESLLSNKNLLEELKIGAVKRASEISWEVMAKTIANDYSAIVNGSLKKTLIKTI